MHFESEIRVQTEPEIIRIYSEYENDIIYNDKQCQIDNVNIRNFDKVVKAIRFTKRTVFLGGKTCTICFKELIEGNYYRITPCKHLFHYDCIFAWIIMKGKEACPNDNHRFIS